MEGQEAWQALRRVGVKAGLFGSGRLPRLTSAKCAGEDIDAARNPT